MALTYEPFNTITVSKVNEKLGGGVEKLNQEFSQYLPLSGGTMTGSINMNGQKITHLADGKSNSDAVTLRQMNSGLVKVGAFHVDPNYSENVISPNSFFSVPGLRYYSIEIGGTILDYQANKVDISTIYQIRLVSGLFFPYQVADFLFTSWSKNRADNNISIIGRVLTMDRDPVLSEVYLPIIYILNS